jgi:hypothetical protein
MMRGLDMKETRRYWMLDSGCWTKGIFRDHPASGIQNPAAAL